MWTGGDVRSGEIESEYTSTVLRRLIDLSRPKLEPTIVLRTVLALRSTKINVFHGRDLRAVNVVLLQIYRVTGRNSFDVSI